MKSYVISHLNNNEALILEAKKHWFSLFPAVLQLFLAFVVMGLTGSIVSLFGAIPMAPKIVRIFLFILSFILVYSAFQNYFVYFSTELGFTDKRLIGKVGLFRVRTLLTPLNKINNVSGFSGFFGRLFKYGSVQIFSSSGQFVYEYVVNHDEFIVALLEQMDIYERDIQNLDAPKPKEGPKVSKADLSASPDLASRKNVLEFEPETSAPAKGLKNPKKKIEEPPRDLKKDEPKDQKSISHCPFCKAPYTVTPEMEGRLSQCTNCKKTFTIKTTDFA
ncbi:MAG: PH domain-containing protein [Deltaproteobacteria bacterium]|jgi:hypothetical protein|nr:PH domain-containing protein [Deltaproteobacteria bacterium]